ncbi:TrbI/VirB10 family protein [Mesorhizobium sp. M3A.F.Ca.ET.174.01.1.1]|uniref:type IV secretion system protein VirB10 n=1 Tax=unclassified Mesorhizobium TaxID=325217 RepID=UPI0010934C61|nr:MULTISPECIES: type IV secretion system protein VirB10 [unclassified Mesorhizobium]TGS85196.1 TrbI/VirB10 family protein [Mesorhizobium sp. M3A.F.Ca.ET.175.01.1.1]TGT23184.1 TrbI/VirB10 family protein [Mesorhizobium sp. M3A.F.Ca.ET.174.01.1.1]
MQRSPELEVLASRDEPAIADRSVRRKQVIGGGVLILIGMVAGYFVVADGRPQQRDMLTGDEEFSTTTFRPPSFARDGEPQPKPAEPEVLQIPPPPPPPPKEEERSDTTEFNVPPPPPPAAAPAPDTAAPSPEDEFPKRYRSNMVVFDNKGSSGERLGSAAGEGQGATVAGEDRNSKFLASAISLGDRTARARKIDRIDALVPEGTLIPGILETAIVSDLPGQIRAIVSQDVYSFDGRRVLIPTGTRLIGEYQSDIVRGQKRIFVIWTRMLRDDGVSVRLDSIGADSLGRSGLTGHVDNKFRERFGAAILLSIVGGGASYLTGYGSQSVSNNSDNSQRAEDIARTTLAQTFSDMANQALGDSLKIPPTISVAQGERIFVFVRQDLDFSALYDDPVSEALKEIRHERGLN